MFALQFMLGNKFWPFVTQTVNRCVEEQKERQKREREKKRVREREIFPITIPVRMKIFHRYSPFSLDSWPCLRQMYLFKTIWHVNIPLTRSKFHSFSNQMRVLKNISTDYTGQIKSLRFCSCSELLFFSGSIQLNISFKTQHWSWDVNSVKW